MGSILDSSEHSFFDIIVRQWSYKKTLIGGEVEIFDSYKIG